jgi:hypothetical protein
VRGGVALCLAAVSSLVALAGCSSGEQTADTCRITGPFGSGRGAVWLLQPAADPESIVLFAHGWAAVEPTDWHRPRLDHLCTNGSVVVFPRYQLDELDTFEDGLDGFRRGVQTAFARLEDVDVPVVAMGYSFDGALVNYYAGHATGWGVPVPHSVLSIFPTTRVPAKPAGEPPSSVEFLLLAGDGDEVVGTAGAEDFLAWLESHHSERRTFRLVRSTDTLTASHEALKETNAASTETFWAPIDELIADARDEG